MTITPAVVEWCQNEALGQVLSDWGDLTYYQVIESLESDGQGYSSHKDIVVWQPFEDQWADFVADQISSLYTSYLDCAKFAKEN
jgi:hypothetical protein